jgi:hypothetical protein
MALSQSPKIVTNGLVLYTDMANSQKSWIGRPSTNTCNYNVYNYTDGNATVTRNTTAPIPPPVAGYEISKIQSNNGSDTSMNILYTSNVDQVNGGVYTHSAWILLTAGTYCRVGQHWNPWDAGSAQYIPLNVWTRVSYTLTNSANNYGNIANAYGTDGTIYVTAVQYEAGSPMTPFMGGSGASRSTSQSILDLIGNNTVTATSLTYASDGTFSFNGTTNRFLVNNTAFNRTTGQEITVSCWIKPSRLGGQYNTIVNCRTDGAYNWMLYMHATDGALSFHGAAQNKTTVIPVVNTWAHVTQTVTSSGVSTLYVNGVLAAIVNGYTYNLTSPGQIGIGAWGTYNGESFQGLISTVQVYNRALSASEVQQNFNAHRGRYGL